MSDADAAMEAAKDNPPPERRPEPFTPLGHDKQRYFFMTAGGGQVISFRGSELGNTSTLIALAPRAWWQSRGFWKEGRAAGIDTQAANEALIEGCNKVGVFEAARCRGRGAWMEGEDSIFHLGDALIVNGRAILPQAHRSRNIYETQQRLDVDLVRSDGSMVEPLSNAEAAALDELCRLASWTQPEAMGRVLAGWLVIAAVCGVMPWRSHLCLTGENGTGKSWLIENVIEAALRGIGLSLASKTTEPAVRGELRGDSRPVLFDEAETQNRNDRERVQQILDVARAASPEGGARISKGVAGGGDVNRTVIRSCFMFSAINDIVSQAADESRVIQLGLFQERDPAKAAENFRKIRTKQAEVMTPDFSARFLSRAIKLAPVIRQNAEIFRVAVAAKTSSRAGQTYGVILAGAWSLRSTKIATAEQAAELVDSQKWVIDAASASVVQPEWARALDHLMQHRERCTIAGRVEDVPIGEIVAKAINWSDDVREEHREAAKVAAGRLGLRVDAGVLWIANTSKGVAAAFSDSPWGSSWRSTMLRAPAAQKSGKTIRFSSALVSMAVGIPIKLVFGDAGK